MFTILLQGTFSHVPKERLGFKLRGGIDKQVTINVRQVNNKVQADMEDSQVGCNIHFYYNTLTLYSCSFSTFYF